MNTVYERDLDLNLLRVFAVVADQCVIAGIAGQGVVALKAIDRVIARMARQAVIEADEGVVKNEDFVAAASKRYWDREPKVRDLA